MKDKAINLLKEKCIAGSYEVSYYGEQSIIVFVQIKSTDTELTVNECEGVDIMLTSLLRGVLTVDFMINKEILER